MNQQCLALLDSQSQQLTQLGDLLQAELTAFVERRPDDIYEIAQQKENLLVAIQSLDKKIASFEDISKLKSELWFTEKVSQIDVMLADIKQQNLVNERVIRTSLNNIQRLKKSILSLQNADAMTYDKQGQAQTQTLGKGIKA